MSRIKVVEAGSGPSSNVRYRIFSDVLILKTAFG
jgi:hypothetical protein